MVTQFTQTRARETAIKTNLTLEEAGVTPRCPPPHSVPPSTPAHLVPVRAEAHGRRTPAYTRAAGPITKSAFVFLALCHTSPSICTAAAAVLYQPIWVKKQCQTIRGSVNTVRYTVNPISSASSHLTHSSNCRPSTVPVIRIIPIVNSRSA